MLGPLEVAPLTDAHPAVTTRTVRTLVAEQASQYARRSVGPRIDGEAMAVFRLGAKYAVRMPRSPEAAAALAKECVALEHFEQNPGVHTSRLMHTGEPGSGLPWRWLVVTWLPGEPAASSPLSDQGLRDLGIALARVHIPASEAAPIVPSCSMPLSSRSSEVLEILSTMRRKASPDGSRLAQQRARRIWNLGTSAPPPTRRVWVHGDAHAHNFLSLHGEFAGLIDWGNFGAGDPAVDLGLLHTAATARGLTHVWEGYRCAEGVLDTETERRARAYALWLCGSLVLRENPSLREMGWRGLSALGVLGPASRGRVTRRDP